MKNTITKTTDYLPDLIKTSSFHFDLNSWPAAVTIIGIGICYVIMYGIEIEYQERILAMNKGDSQNAKTEEENKNEQLYS